MQRHQNFALAATFLIRMTKNSKTDTSHTIRKICEKSGPFFRGICPGRWILLDFHVFSIKKSIKFKGFGLSASSDVFKILQNPLSGHSGTRLELGRAPAEAADASRRPAGLENLISDRCPTVPNMSTWGPHIFSILSKGGRIESRRSF